MKHYKYNLKSSEEDFHLEINGDEVSYRFNNYNQTTHEGKTIHQFKLVPNQKLYYPIDRKNCDTKSLIRTTDKSMQLSLSKK